MRLGVRQKNSRPNYPSTCGKVERFQQTLKGGCAPSPPKANATNAGTGRHERVRHDRTDASGGVTLRHAGRLHHSGIGRTQVLLLVQDVNIRIVHASTGELLPELTLDPSTDYQPQPIRNP